MTRRHRIQALCCTLPAVALSLTGCVASRPQQFANSFLPAAPPAVTIEPEAPPRIAPNLYSNEKPQLASPMVVAAQSAAEDRLRRADQRFQSGKRLYQQGDVDGARREFDAAVDLLLNAPLDMPDRQKLERRLDTLSEDISRYDRDAQNASGEEQVVYEKSPLDSGILEMTFPTDPKLKPKVGEELHGTISQLPLDANDAVLSYIHYFSTERGRRTLVTGLRRGGRYQDLVRRILDEEGVPQELLYLAQAESGFIPYAMSNKKAIGMWQFVSSRAREYGLEQTSLSDDRLDPEKATRAAARHLRDLYGQFGDWYLAMAAYDCGPNCVERAVERTGFADFWELRARNALPKETQNYVPLILAITIMAKNPADYGLEDIDADRPLDFDIVPIDKPTSLWLVADATDYPLSEIRDLNPALLKPMAPDGYQLRVPRGAGTAVMSALSRVPDEARTSWRLHRVTDGETLPLIARQYQAAPGAIAAANNLTASAAPTAGDLLLIPTVAHSERGMTKSGLNHLAVRHRRSAEKETLAARRAVNGHRRTSVRLLHTSTHKARS